MNVAVLLARTVAWERSGAGKQHRYIHQPKQGKAVAMDRETSGMTYNTKT